MKILKAAALAIAFCLFTGCDVLGALEITPSPTPIPTPSPSPAPRVITFKDPIVERIIRSMLGKADGPITDQDMLKVSRFDFNSSFVKVYGGKVETLEDLRWCVNLRRFALSDTGITDISALSGARDLDEFLCTEKLDDYTPLLGGKNLSKIQLTGVTDDFFRELMKNCSRLDVVYLHQSAISSESIRLLAENYKLSILSLTSCGITDISPAAGFTGLTYLSFEYNEIEDISPLAGNPRISEQIDLSANKITDWSPLEGMTSLRYLSVRDNPVTESPALDTLHKNGCTIYR